MNILSKFVNITSMPKRGRKRKIRFKLSGDNAKSILVVFLFLAAAMSTISFFLPTYAVNAKIQEVLHRGFGYASVLVPIVLTLAGFLCIRSLKIRFVQLKALVGLTGALVSLSSILALAKGEKFGGLLGVFLVQKTAGLVSVYGAAVLYLALLAISFILLLDLSFDDLVEKAQKLFEKLLKGFGKEKAAVGKKKASLKISSGAQALDREEWDEEEKEEELPSPAFEVIPSMSEPQLGMQSSVGGLGDVSVGPPALPYADRVWEPPPLDLLNDPSTAPADRGDVKTRAKIIEDTLRSFGVDARVAEFNYGPSVTQYALEASTGTKITKISNLQYDLALALASPTGSVRIEAPIPGRSLIGIEVPNNTIVNVNFKELLISEPMKAMKSKLGIVLGKDVSGSPRIYDIARMPHLLVAGATGSGKSVFLHSIIFSLLFRNSPAECRFILVDPKRVELVHYADIPHLYTPVVTDTDRASSVFKWACAEMERRYKLFETAKVRNIEGYNEKSGFQALPYIMIIVDELAEIMVSDPASVEKSIIRLAQLARATGMHLLLTVQRPSTNVITGLIKANIPCRVAFNVASQVDSRVVIDQPGAEKLLGRGDMLFVPPDASKPIRIQGAFVTDGEINKLVSYLKSSGNPEYKEDIFTAGNISSTRSVSVGGSVMDPLFDEAVEIVVSARKASASLLQRRLSIGYARAARILDELEAKGMIGPAKGSKPRDVLAPQPQIDFLSGNSSDNFSTEEIPPEL